MKLDKNTIIGFGLLFILLIGYFYYNSKSQQSLAEHQRKINDSLLTEKKKQDSLIALEENNVDTTTIKSSTKKITHKAQTEVSLFTKDSTFSFENTVMKVIFKNKGAQIDQLILKKYKNYNDSALELIKSQTHSLNYFIKNPYGKSEYVKDIIFHEPTFKTLADSTTEITFLYGDTNAQYLYHRYLLKPNEYMLGFEIGYSQAEDWFPQKDLQITWGNSLYQVERSAEYERTSSQINIRQNNEFDYFGIRGDLDKEFEKDIQWVGIKQQFFNLTFLAKQNFSSAKITSNIPNDTTTLISTSTFNLVSSIPNAPQKDVKFQFYFGPNEFKTLANYNQDLERIINFGQGIYSFIKYINRWIILPAFDMFMKLFPNYGIAIMFLTILLRIITSPLAYKGYLSAAKMKVIKPEVDELKAKYGDDKQTFSFKQMELYRSAGVNPLGGCLPALLQLPIFVSLYYFFNATIEIRGHGFLWCKDISSYDSILNLGFNIPLYGDHVSLFTLLTVVTTFLSTFLGMGMNPSAGADSNPALKYMPYIIPIFFLGFFNKMPAALTWYYTISNIITLLLQLFIQKFVINHDKISLQIAEYRTKPKKKSVLQERMAKIQESQQKLKDLKNKSKK